MGFTGAATLSEINVVLLRPLDVPVTLTSTVPTAATLLAANLNVLVPVALLGSKDAVTPLGKSEAVRLTLPLNPSCGITVITLLPVAPRATIKLLGDADKV